MTKPKLIILGGYGTFGSLIADQLADSEAEVLIAGRDTAKGKAFADSLGVAFVRCDATSESSLRDTVRGSHLLINASGPFQAKDYSIAKMCIEHGCHYIDLGDGREYVAGIGQLDEAAKARGVFVCVGASTTPAVTSAAVEEIRPYLQNIRSIKVALTAGNKIPAGVSTIASILSYVGKPVHVWRDSQWRQETGWGLGEFINFPGPVGRRRVQLCDVPDLAIFPERFQAKQVIFKAGVEMTMFNYVIAFMDQVQRLFPSLNLPALATPVVWMSRLFKWLGTTHGCVAVWVTGEDGQEKALAFVAPQNGPRVPTSPAVLLARRILAKGVPVPGAHPCVGFLSLMEFADYLSPFGIRVICGENGSWVLH